MGNLKLFTGTQRLLQDAQAPLLIITTAVGVVFTIYFSVRKGMADQQEQHIWDKRRMALWIGVAIAFAGQGIIQLLQTYYG